MKLSLITTIGVAALLGLASCNKQYDVKVEESQTNGTAGSGGGAGIGFNWKGTAPMSAKLNGQPWLATQMTVSNAAGLYYNVLGQTDDVILSVSIPANAKAGQVFAMPAPSGTSLVLPVAVTMGTSGSLKVTVNNASTLEGYFFSTVKTVAGTGTVDTTIRISEGYFKVNK
ncbi:hypothetical protein [Taibaiella koreensis]|uniref:hypothetical protein n=1 Tax=Taibaiella koreensis TaxID=1268548 RepID=UPI000E59B15B|nr:hypothetical protein [Taibaiella koreensis]